MAERGRQRVRDLRMLGVLIDTVRTAPLQQDRGRGDSGSREAVPRVLTHACGRTATPAGGATGFAQQRQASVSAHRLLSKPRNPAPALRSTQRLVDPASARQTRGCILLGQRGRALAACPGRCIPCARIPMSQERGTDLLAIVHPVRGGSKHRLCACAVIALPRPPVITLCPDVTPFRLRISFALSLPHTPRTARLLP